MKEGLIVQANLPRLSNFFAEQGGECLIDNIFFFTVEGWSLCCKAKNGRSWWDIAESYGDLGECSGEEVDFPTTFLEAGDLQMLGYVYKDVPEIYEGYKKVYNLVQSGEIVIADY